MLKRVYIWELPVRIYHWINAITLAILAVTGYYIGNPFIAVGPGEAYSNYVMGTVRFIHYVAATVFGLNFFIRLYWAFVGNEFAQWKGLLPITKKRIQDLPHQVKYYALLSPNPPPYLGHNPVAGLSYVALFILTAIQGITGLALNAEISPGGFWWKFFSWAFLIASNQTLRLVHHLLMYVFIAFFIIHLYMAVVYDILEGEGTISSIVSGYKFARADEE